VASAQATDDAPPRELPRGPHRLSRDVVLASQRGRLIEAMIGAVADKGYAGTTVADVVARAGVSRKTFYEQFVDREDCFLASYDACVDILLARLVAGVGAADGTWTDRVRAGVRAYLDVLAAEPAAARTFLVEVLAAGPRALERRAAVHERFAALVCGLHAEARADHPRLPEVPPEAVRALVGGMDQVVSDRVREGRGAGLRDLEDALTWFQLAILAGPDVAARATA
jgi:AcrR family transcriptional regulator